MKILRFIVAVISVVGWSLLPAYGQAAVTVKLAENGRALLPVVVSPQAGEAEKAAAVTLAQYLERITGGEFQVETAQAALTAQTRGIVLGVAGRFAPMPEKFQLDDPTASEEYWLYSHSDGVVIAGASQQAVEHAVWDFLYRLGHRQFFPGEKWEVVPVERNLAVALDVFERPAYLARRVWPGFGVLAENRQAFLEWDKRNRMGSGVVLSTGHAYGNIIRRNKAEFEKHPEYLTRPGGDKFCVSNPGLQQLVINDALAQFEKNPGLQSISLDPSDGGGWESDSCRDAQVYGSVTDRVIALANMVAEAVNKKFPGKYVGLYAYNEHSPPPTIAVHPNVIPSIATSFIRGGFNVESLFRGWNEKAAQLGVREYYSVNTWDRDLPGRARGGNLATLTKTVPDFHARGARFMRAESSDNWGPNGLGYYILARLLWDTAQAQQVEALTADFLEKAFGTAQEPMAEFYRLIDGSNKPLLSTDLIGRMYIQLDTALQGTQDAAVLARVRDLVLYTRYVELYAAYSQASGAARQKAFEELLRFAWRIRRTHMVHTLGLWRDLDGRDDAVKIPIGSGYGVKEENDPWKSSEPFTPSQIQHFVTEGIANNKRLEFVPQAFSTDLVPATALGLRTARPGSFPMLRGTRTAYTWVEKAPGMVAFQASGGHIYNNRGEVRFDLFPQGEPEGKAVAQAAVAADKQRHEAQLVTSYEGLQLLVMADGSGGTTLEWPAGVPLVFESSLDEAPVFAGGHWSLYFYVPKGTKVVGGYRTSTGRITTPDGKTALALAAEGAPGFWQVPVAPGQDGKLWQYTGKGQLKLMTVPSYLARSAQELLLPREVVEADAS